MATANVVLLALAQTPPSPPPLYFSDAGTGIGRWGSDLRVSENEYGTVVETSVEAFDAAAALFCYTDGNLKGDCHVISFDAATSSLSKGPALSFSPGSRTDNSLGYSLEDAEAATFDATTGIVCYNKGCAGGCTYPGACPNATSGHCWVGSFNTANDANSGVCKIISRTSSDPTTLTLDDSSEFAFNQGTTQDIEVARWDATRAVVCYIRDGSSSSHHTTDVTGYACKVLTLSGAATTGFTLSASTEVMMLSSGGRQSYAAAFDASTFIVCYKACTAITVSGSTLTAGAELHLQPYSLATTDANGAPDTQGYGGVVEQSVGILSPTAAVVCYQNATAGTFQGFQGQEDSGYPTCALVSRSGTTLTVESAVQIQIGQVHLPLTASDRTRCGCDTYSLNVHLTSPSHLPHMAGIHAQRRRLLEHDRRRLLRQPRRPPRRRRGQQLAGRVRRAHHRFDHHHRRQPVRCQPRLHQPAARRQL
jgi:hypothetical protein